MSRTLVIHPKDVTTDFLIPVWKNNPEWTVVRSNIVSKSELRSHIKQHDRIICMGHGCEEGLFRNSKFDSLMIDSTYVQMLREKDCVFVWCNSDVFFLKYNLRGFFTGMVISEPHEALYFKVPFNTDDISNANRKLTLSLSEGVKYDTRTMFDVVKSKMTPESSIESFNFNRIYFK